MVCCSVHGCNNSTNNKNPGITFHVFPRDPKQCEKWLIGLKQSYWKPKKNSRICSKHFDEKYIDRSSLCNVRLRAGAIPTLFPALAAYALAYGVKKESGETSKERRLKQPTKTPPPKQLANSPLPELETSTAQPTVVTPITQLETSTAQPTVVTPITQLETSTAQPTVVTPITQLETSTAQPTVVTPITQLETSTAQPTVVTPITQLETSTAQPTAVTPILQLETSTAQPTAVTPILQLETSTAQQPAAIVLTPGWLAIRTSSAPKPSQQPEVSVLKVIDLKKVQRIGGSKAQQPVGSTTQPAALTHLTQSETLTAQQSAVTPLRKRDTSTAQPSVVTPIQKRETSTAQQSAVTPTPLTELETSPAQQPAAIVIPRRLARKQSFSPKKPPQKPAVLLLQQLLESTSQPPALTRLQKRETSTAEQPVVTPLQKRETSTAQQPVVTPLEKRETTTAQQPAVTPLENCETSTAQEPAVSRLQQLLESTSQPPYITRLQKRETSTAQQSAVSRIQQLAASSAQQPTVIVFPQESTIENGFICPKLAKKPPQQLPASIAQQPEGSTAQKPAVTHVQQLETSNSQKPAEMVFTLTVAKQMGFISPKSARKLTKKLLVRERALKNERQKRFRLEKKLSEMSKLVAQMEV